MRIWIDGDACPNQIKDILFRAAIRTKTEVIIVANHTISIPSSPFIKRLQVESGFDVADNKITENIQPNDLVVTADIPLASEVINKKAIALNPRGELYTKANIKQKRAMRDFNESLRESGMISGTVAKLSSADIRRFANNLDAFLSKYIEPK
ncbi:YaiI/YqxD family protein [Legionella israelensis]|uniref:YaiI/YqxD family protein n=1 Tax=Legionella israelensis TaxID=454 RepID=UPI00117C6506|nr:YaiI/YqxD family protein [Legionella israelensis]QDP71263.1 YaiI/YqxD family protein [Legionella israelensis]